MGKELAKQLLMSKDLERDLNREKNLADSSRHELTTLKQHLGDTKTQLNAALMDMVRLTANVKGAKQLLCSDRCAG